MSPVRIATGLALVLLLEAPGSPAHAQVGGLVKKAREKVAPAATAQPTTDEPARLPGPTLTPAVVDHFLVGLKAEKGEQDRQAKQQERRAAAERRKKDPKASAESCRSEVVQNDPKARERDSLTKAAEAAAERKDYATAQQIALSVQTSVLELQARADSICASIRPEPPPEQEAMRTASVSPGEAGATAAGMTAVEYGQVRELLQTYLQYPARAGLSPEEKQAVDPKRTELLAAFQALGE